MVNTQDEQKIHSERRFQAALKLYNGRFSIASHSDMTEAQRRADSRKAAIRAIEQADILLEALGE